MTGNWFFLYEESNLNDTGAVSLYLFQHLHLVVLLSSDLAELMVIDSFTVDEDDNEDDPPTCSFEDAYYEMDY